MKNHIKNKFNTKKSNVRMMIYMKIEIIVSFMRIFKLKKYKMKEKIS